MSNIFQFWMVFVIIYLPKCGGQDCTTVFNQVSGNVISRGATSTQDKTPAACEQSCRNNSACKSYQIDTNADHAFCWIQLSDNPFVTSNLYFDINTNEFMRSTSCNGCVAQFTKVLNNVISRGATSTQDTTPAACEQSCRNNNICKSYQLDNNTGHALCWIQLSDDAFGQDNLYIDPNINEFFKNVSCTNCFIDFYMVSNYATIDATPYPNILNQEDCRARCINLSACVSYQFDFNAGASARCWIQNASKPFFLRNGVTEFTKFNNCSTPNCPPRFAPLTNNIATPGATPRTEFISNMTCRDGCFQDAQCFSYQIDTNINRQSLCWFQTDNQKLINNEFNSRPGVFEYAKDTTYCINQSTTAILTTTTIAPACAYTFVMQTPSYATLGAIPSPMFATNDSCRQGCLNNANCVSYQLDFTQRETLCWLQFSEGAKSQVYLRLNVYEFFKICPASSSQSISASTLSQACTPIFNAPRTDLISIKATPINNILNIQDCNNFCLSSMSCLSYQIDTNPSNTLCWIQNNETNLAIENLFTRPGVSEYVKNTTYCFSSPSVTACPPSFNEPRPNSVSGSATPRADITTETACKNTCLNSPACVSYQIEYNSNSVFTCWIQTNSINLDQNNLIIRPGVIEYVKNTTYCLYSTTLSTGVPCILIFIPQTPGQGSINAIPNATFPSSESCRLACLSDNKCVSYQINSNTNLILCWLQFDQISLSGPKYSQPNVIEYVKSCSQNISTTSIANPSTSTSCSNVQYRTNPTNQATIGAQAIGAATFQDCQSFCTADLTCLTFQINPVFPNPYCWIQRNPNALQQLYLQPGVTEYIKYCPNALSTTETSTACVNTFAPLESNRGTIQAQRQTYTTEEQCRSNCLFDPSCLSYQINSNPSETLCWYQRNPQSFNQLYYQAGVQENRKVCLQTESTISTSTCISTFEPSQPNRGTINAQRQIYNTENQCRNNCLIDPACFSYQINMNQNSSFCWFQRNAQNLNQSYFQPGVQEYRKVCLSSISTASSCVITYEPRNVASILATPAPSLTTNEQCELSCTQDNFCLSYQINTNPNQVRCWLQRSSIQEVYFQDNVTEYIKNTNCFPNATTLTVPTTTSLTSTSSTITIPVSCSIIYQVPNPGYLSQGATERQTLNVTTCEGNCTSDPMCRSYQLVGTSCWHQLNPINNLYYTDMTYFEYVKICVSDCTGGINFVPDNTGFISNEAEGRPQLNEVQCRDECLIDSFCKSYQIEKSSGTLCWIQRGTSPFLGRNLYTKTTTITEYKKFCGTWYGPSTTSSTITTMSVTTSPIFVTTPSSISTSASTITSTRRITPMPRFTTPPRNISTSSTIFSTSTNVVRTSSSSSFMNTTSSSSTTSTTVSAATTTSGCQTSYIWSPPIVNQNMAGGTYNRATTLQTCQSACIALDTCIGIDVDLNSVPLSCYLLTRFVSLTQAQGVTHFDLIRTQQGCVTSSTLTPNIPTTCPTVVKSYGMNADAGIQVANNVNEDACLNICISDALCTSVDFAVQARSCYVHRTNVQNQANSCCVKYTKCTVSTPPSVCQSLFSEFLGFTPNVRFGYSSITTSLENCRSSCLTSNCTSFSYFGSSSSCYLFRGEMSSIGIQSGSTYYIRNFCLGNINIPTPTSTTALVTPGPGECLIDLALILDSSGSVNENSNKDNWSYQKDFAVTIASRAIRYGYYMDHLAVLIFSDSENIIFDFNRIFSNFSELATTIRNLPFLGAQTNIPAAISGGRRLFQDPNSGSRPNTIHAMVLITDGVVSPPWTSNFLPEIAQLNATNIKRYAVGVGNLVSMQQLNQYASPGGSFWVPSFTNINDALSNLTLFINQFPCTPISQSQFSSTPTQRPLTSSTTSRLPPTSTTSRLPPTSTTTSTTTLTTSSSGPLNGVDCTFGVSLSNNVNGPVNPLLADTVYANRLNGWIQSTDSCRMGLSSSNSVVEICAGIPAASTAQIVTEGAYPTPIGFDWFSNSQNDVETGCRSAIVSFSRGVAINLRLSNGNIYSLGKQAGWSSFSVTNSIFNANYLFSGYSSESYSRYNILRFPNPHITPSDNLFNTAENSYNCRNSAYYYFSFSAGVPANQNAVIMLEGLGKSYTAQRYSTANGLTTISRSILVPCSSKVTLALQLGQIVPGNGSNLISFSAFPYNTRFGILAAWAAYRSSDSIEMNPLNFDDWVINQGIQTSDNALVIISTSGYYYVYISIGTVANQKSSVTLRRNNNVVFTIDRQSTIFTGSDVLGRGIVIQLQQLDILKVVVERGTSVSSNTFGYQTSFFGFFLGA